MLPSIVNLLSFITVAETGQFKLAAKKLNLTESAISHQISRLENQLSVQLFERLRAGVELTEKGHVFHHHIAVGLDEIRNGMAAVTTKQNNLVSISAPRTFAALWLAPKISSFAMNFPDIDLQITATDRICDLKQENVDIAIRVSDVEWPGCEQSLLFHQELTPVANIELAKRSKLLGWKKTLQQIPFIINQTHPREWQEWSEQTGMNIQDNSKFKKLESYDIVQAAAIRGFGIALARTPIGSEALSDGRLVKLHPDKTSQDLPYHLVWQKSRKIKEATRKFKDWIGQSQDWQT